MGIGITIRKKSPAVRSSTDPIHYRFANAYSVLAVQHWSPKDAIPESKAAALKALEIDERAVEIDPLSPLMNGDLGYALYVARQYDQAINQFRKAMGLEPKYSLTHAQLGSAYLQKGAYGEAIREMQKAEQLEKTAEVLGRAGNAYAVAGKRNEAERVLQGLMELSKQRYVPPFGASLIHIGLGDRDQAFESPEKAYEERSAWLIWIKADPLFDSIRSDPRFADLLRRMGLLA